MIPKFCILINMKKTLGVYNIVCYIQCNHKSLYIIWKRLKVYTTLYVIYNVIIRLHKKLTYSI